MQGAGEPTHSVIWMHGLGASNRDFEDVVPELGLPHCRFVFPAAPSRPVTINGGLAMPAWYDILSLADPPLREAEPDVRQSAVAVAGLIAREQERGIPSERIFLAGFSQGAAMALHIGTRHAERLAGVVVMSGYLLLPDSFEAERSAANGQTPILFCHGTFDPVVPLALGQQAYRRLTGAQYPTAFRTYPMAHSLCLEEVGDLAEFFRSHAPEL